MSQNCSKLFNSALSEELKIPTQKKKNFHRYFLLFFLTSMLFLMMDSNVHADSIWKKRVTVNTNLFNDNRARGIGDIVTVLINESTEITGKEDSSADSKQSHNVTIDT